MYQNARCNNKNRLSLFIHIHTHIHIIFMYICKVCMCVCMYVCTCMYIHTYTYMYIKMSANYQCRWNLQKALLSDDLDNVYYKCDIGMSELSFIINSQKS